ncbi:hypothetical protein [Streptomyces spongiae]|uniref:hypothetical protein n=1 Tax=Streptomyces spongiae TaxID=565072 RepID=UPI002AD3157E|nr:hypothetical protein [Streptomyces spongiae]
MLHTVLRRRANGESVEQIQPDLIIPTGRRKGQNPSVASVYRALAEHAKRETYPEAIKAAHADFAALQAGEVPGVRRPPRSVTSNHVSGYRCFPFGYSPRAERPRPSSSAALRSATVSMVARAVSTSRRSWMPSRLRAA